MIFLGSRDPSQRRKSDSKDHNKQVHVTDSLKKKSQFAVIQLGRG